MEKAVKRLDLKDDVPEDDIGALIEGGSKLQVDAFVNFLKPFLVAKLTAKANDAAAQHSDLALPSFNLF